RNRLPAGPPPAVRRPSGRPPDEARAGGDVCRCNNDLVIFPFHGHESAWSGMSSEETLWFRRYLPATNPGARLVCLPHAGGSAPFFRPVAIALGRDVDVVAVQYPGRQDRRAEKPVSDMAVLADRVADLLRGQSPLPLTLFGHSMGAILAFEVARRLEADGNPPVRVF